MIETINKYIIAGLSCLPTQKDKSPKKGIKWKDNIDLKEFDQFGIGIKCGEPSHGLECIDFDNHFGDAKQILSEYLNIDEVKEIYTKYKLPIESTMSGGFHLLFRCSKNEGNLKLAQRPKWDENTKRFKPDTIIETRGEGGYFVCAPTEGYKIIRNDILNIQEITIEERECFINSAKTFNEWIDQKTTEYEQKERPGDYFNDKMESIDEMKSCLLRNGWKNLRGNTWQRPGKKTGISATLGKVAPNVFYVFSSNAYPFEPESGYKPFQVIGLLDYKGNFKDYASELAKRYNLSTPDTYQKKEIEKPKEKNLTDKEKDDLLSKFYVDVTIPVDKPPIVMYINHGDRFSQRWRRLMTLSNFSCITGKSKAKKTFLVTKLINIFGINYYDEQVKFKAELPENKRMILHFDTEQSEYDSYISGKRIHDMAGKYMEHVGTFGFRELRPIERMQLIGYAIEKFKDNIGVVFIDGIADLVKSINSEDEADEILYLFMRWTKIYNLHICCILHQNKKDNFATGWLGTQIMKKCELVMAVEKDADDSKYSRVSCDVIRGAEDFKDFYFFINEDGYPIICDQRESIEYKTLM